jgi:hypothetical protein
MTIDWNEVDLVAVFGGSLIGAIAFGIFVFAWAAL